MTGLDIPNEQLFKEFLDTDRKFFKKNKVATYLIGNFYIGITTNLRQRLRSHMADCFADRHANKDFQRIVLERYSRVEFIGVKILDNCPNEFSEIEYIKEYKEAGWPLVNHIQRRYCEKADPITEVINSIPAIESDMISKEKVLIRLTSLRASLYKTQEETGIVIFNNAPKISAQ